MDTRDTLDLPTWDPDQYARFEAQRDRAALDLLLRLPDDLEPREIWDLGCGAGQHASLLKRRHPEATVYGLDASAAMIDKARARSEAVRWVVGDVASWRPERPADLIFCNASLQWLGDHQGLFDRLARALAHGGVLAVQMPMAHETRHHTIMRDVAAEGPWAARLAGAETIQPLLDAQAYYAVLAQLCGEIDCWATTYLHALTGENAVLEWMKGTALRPYLTALEGEPSRDAFLDALSEPLSQAFPMRADGVTLMPFPRLFVVARRGA